MCPRLSPDVPEPDDDLALRAVLANARRRGDHRHAERAFLQATQDLSVCSTAAWERARQNGTTAEQLFVELQKTRFLLREARERAEILTARLDKRDPRRRPHYTPPLRFQILEHMKKYLLSVEETARRFLVTPQTIYNWLDELRQHPDKKTVGSTVRPVPPVRRFSQGVRRLVRQMKQAGFGGQKKIAETLLRHAWRISPRSVGRICRERPPAPTPELGPGDTATEDRPTTVRGDHPNHLWLQDITEIPTLFPFLSFHLMLVLDACSRLPLAASLHLISPSAARAVALLARAIRTHGRPRHLVVDQGGQFKAPRFQHFVRGQKVRIRYGAVGKTHSLGLIDRCFRTLKDSLSLRSLRPWNTRELRRRLKLALIHYAYIRPHASLEGFTPIERYYGIRGPPATADLTAAGQSRRPRARGPFRLRFPRSRERGVSRSLPQSCLSRSVGRSVGEGETCSSGGVDVVSAGSRAYRDQENARSKRPEGRTRRVKTPIGHLHYTG